MTKPQKPDTEGGCWGRLSNGSGWDGFKRTVIGYCDKKPRPGCLTCWWHRLQEGEAKRFKAKLEAQEMVKLEATTCFHSCFHCGDPALPETHGEAPRCERHRDV